MGCKVYFNSTHSKDCTDRKETLKRLKIKQEIIDYNNLYETWRCQDHMVPC